MVTNIAGAASGFEGYVAGYFGSLMVALMITPGEVWYIAVSAGLVSATMGAAISAITGVALRQLLKRPIPETFTPPPSTTRED